MKRVDQRKLRAMIARIAALQVYLEELDSELRKPAPELCRTRATKYAQQVETRAQTVAACTREIVNSLRSLPSLPPPPPSPGTGR